MKRLSVLVDKDLKVLLCDREATSFFKKPINKLKSESILALWSAANREAIGKCFNTALKGGTIENELANNDSSYWKLKFTPFRSREDNNICGVMLTGEDIDESEILQKEDKKRNKFLKKIYWGREHYLKTPLVHLINLAALMEYSPQDTEILDFVKGELNKLDSMVRKTINEAYRYYYEKTTQN